MANDTWFSRELPVLDAVVQAFDANEPGLISDGGDLIEATGLEADDVAKALIALNGEFIRLNITGSVHDWSVSGVSGAARRAVGAWPNPEVLTDRVIAAISDAADGSSDPETKGRLRRVAESLGGATREIVVKAVAEVVARQVGT